MESQNATASPLSCHKIPVAKDVVVVLLPGLDKALRRKDRTTLAEKF